MRPSSVLVLYGTYLDVTTLLVKRQGEELYGFPEDYVRKDQIMEDVIEELFNDLGIQIDFGRIEYGGYSDSRSRDSIVHIFSYLDYFTPKIKLNNFTDRYSDYQFISLPKIGSLELVRGHEMILSNFLIEAFKHNENTKYLL